MLKRKIEYLFSCDYFADDFDPEGNEIHYDMAQELLDNFEWNLIYKEIFKHLIGECKTPKDIYNFCNLYFSYLFDEQEVPNPYEFLGFITYKIDLDNNWDNYGDFIDSFAISILEKSNLVDTVKNPYYNFLKDPKIIEAIETWRNNDVTNWYKQIH